MNRAMPPPTNRVKEVTFKVSRPDGQYGLHKLADTTFALGLGPCGRWVQRLEVEVTDHLLRIRQHSTEFDITEVSTSSLTPRSPLGWVHVAAGSNALRWRLQTTC
ncbi:hypothetical protein [Pseudomonas phage phiPstE]|nr:hypothetical protein [Pseudomonas phage phiPstE]